MDAPDLFLFEDAVARGWSPFAETRPVGELRFGAWTLRERAMRAAGVTRADYLGVPGLDGFEEPGAGRPLLDVPAESGAHGARIWLSRAAAAADLGGPIESPAVLGASGRVAGLELPAGHALPDDLDGLFASTPDEAAASLGGSVRAVDALLLDGPWDLVSENGDALRADLEASCTFTDAPLPDGVHLVGPGRVSLGAGAEIGPGVILDTRGGPIRLDDGCTVDGPARLVGPLHLGPGSVVFGGHLANVCTGPVCKLRGEIADSVICGYSNKAHDGYLGHALLGRWVNLGAGTTNSDLKNNYSEIRVTTGAGTFDTGRIKVGVFLGDHVKTGIGTMLNTGTAIGAGSNVFGGGMPPKWVPPFSWSWPKGNRPYRFDAFEEVARIVAGRRDQPWPDGMTALFRRLHETTHGTDPGPADPGA